jgi:hypothetical protein
VLDKGLVIAGDIKISLADVELLAIRIRLIVCSLDKAQEIGLDWWKYDRNLAAGGTLTAENEALRAQTKALERQVEVLSQNAAPVTRRLTLPRGAGGTMPSKGAPAVARAKLPRTRPLVEPPAAPRGKPGGQG